MLMKVACLVKTRHTARDAFQLRRDQTTGLEALGARFHSHAYDMHFHDEWLVGVTHYGVQDFFCRGQRRQSTTGKIMLIEPGELHDGQAIQDDGFAYSMLYLPQSLIRQEMGGNDAAIGFRSTLTDDPQLAQAVMRTTSLIIEAATRLSVEESRDQIIALLCRHLGRAEPKPDIIASDISARAMDYLRAHFEEDIGLEQLVEAVGATDRFSLSRSFRRRYGTSLHAYLVQLRLAAARRLLREQETPAQAAMLSGFADQSHMGRWFRRAYRLTPAQYRRGRTNVPDLPR